jgi:dephospho-CoA kinase
MLVVGLTGNIGSGKSAVAKLIGARGVPVIDADVLSREAVAPGAPALERIVARWGPHVLKPDGSLDRPTLSRLVFGHLAELDALNSIVHPEVRRMCDTLVAAARHRGDRVVLCDIPLLYETNLASQMDVVLLVDAPREVRLDRLVKNRGFSLSVAEAVMATQMASEQKRERADYVIDNGGSLESLSKQVDTVWTAIAARAAGR